MCTTGWADILVYLAMVGLIAFAAWLLGRAEDVYFEEHAEWCTCNDCMEEE